MLPSIIIKTLDRASTPLTTSTAAMTPTVTTNASTTATTTTKTTKFTDNIKMILVLLVILVIVNDHFVTWDQYRYLNMITTSDSTGTTTRTTRTDNTNNSNSNNNDSLESWMAFLFSSTSYASLSTSTESSMAYLGNEQPLLRPVDAGDAHHEEEEDDDDENEIITVVAVEIPPNVTTIPIVATTNETTTIDNVEHNNTIRSPHRTKTDMDPVFLESIVTAGRMYSICGPDRSGNVIADLLYAHAFAYGHNITYGGSCCLRPIYPTNTTRNLLQALQWEALFPFQCPDGVDSVKYRHLRIDSTELVQSIHPLLLYKDTYRIDGDQSYFTPAWRQYVETILNEQKSNDSNSNNKNKIDAASDVAMATTNMDTTDTTTSYDRQENTTYEIAVHIRRGDVSPCTHPRRYLPNSHYLALIEQYTPSTENTLRGRTVHVTIYSESDTFESLDVFRERNYTLELDTDDLGQVWKALSTANVVILSRSTFSIVPAILNPNIVVATEFMNFNPNHVLDGEFDVRMIDGWEQADSQLVQHSDRMIHDMVRTQCEP